MLLAFDCETTGLLVKDKPLNDPAQPRMVQLGFTVQDAGRRVVHSYSTLIAPDGWEITKSAASAHGYTTEDCARFGVEAKVAMLNFVSALKTVKFAVAHGMSFDAALVQRELDILNAADQGLRRPRLRRICTMKTTAAITSDGKWPTLDAAHKLMTGRHLHNAHDALADAEATAVVFWGLVDRRIIEV
jgi:DNA polymerase-3 subunit epsilon